MKTVLEKKLRASLRGLGIPPDAKIVVGVSGGADSTALADALARQHKGPVAIAHLNHLLRGAESDEDAEFVKVFASGIGVEAIIERVDIAAIARGEGRNIEAVARDVRYSFLARAATASGSVFVTTGHTQDDQVETICMRVLRGTGPEGLRGIHLRRPLDDGVTLIRPLIEVTRAEVLEHCGVRDLRFRTDSSNLSRDLVRNRVRHELLPHLRSFNPRLDEALLRMAAIIGEDDELLNKQAGQVLEEARESDSRLSQRRLREEHPAIRRRVLRLWLRAVRGDLRRIDAVHLAAVERLLLSGEGGKRVELPGGLIVTRKLRTLVLEKTNRTPTELEVGKRRAKSRAI